ncbi:prolyl oligopeptidase family serine peptidase [Qipengyuania oceanensis]|uniref:prolyl oligopeptidase n=1 Tax=Qipengyuania oceanensis TaxID=1463597 RepID=A0A844YAP8_9SPHN|nr:prolyl oligopeptidase family serine peptidase [Qipengyuania oceanensis]MXO62016.1 prolyl oligopeptidase family serine peptidase [Qipengyuania oceanensis]
MIRKSHAVSSAVAMLLAASPAAIFAQDAALPDYPETRAEAVEDVIFGETVADPYRWLEQDVRQSSEVADWVARQNAFSDSVLDRIPETAWFKAKLAELIDYERYDVPVVAGGRYFFGYNSGLQNQSQLFVQDGPDAARRLLIDPNAWAKDGATALGDIRPSPDGRRLLYSIQDGGSDWRQLKVLDVDSGKDLPDAIDGVKFPIRYNNWDWVDGDSFLYGRFDIPAAGEEFQATSLNNRVYYHRIGTDQSDDLLVFATPDEPERSNDALVSHDGSWAVLRSRQATEERNEIRVIDLRRTGIDRWQNRMLVPGFEHEWDFLDAIGATLYFRTNQGAPTYRVVAIDMDASEPRWQVVVPQGDFPIDHASIVGDRLIVSYLQDAASKVAVFGLDGSRKDDIRLGGIGAAEGFGGSPASSDTFYSFSSFNRPATIYRLDPATGESSVFAAPRLTFDPGDYLVEQKFYASRDGTRVPMFIVRRSDVSGPAPTLLYGYGGFDISLTPGFSTTRMAWLAAGGVYALANIRGGGEYGKDWHDAGRRANKQNVFDDFIAAGEWLKANGYTSEDGLAIQGGSNGGLLVGAVSNQRPDLFAAANPQVGVMDMLRFDRWTAGRTWVDDYGYPEREEDWKILRAYSPYHNIRAGEDYPAIIVTTADTDDRVVPGHSFKYAAALQAAEIGDEPHIIRIETRAGHGSGKPTDKLIEEYGEILGFLAHHAGLQVPVIAEKSDE